MKKKLLSLLLLGGLTLTAGAQYQLPNPGFEGDWETVKGNYNTTETEKEPLHWNSFVSCNGYNGGMLSFLANPIKTAQKAGHLFESTDVRPNASSNSKKCALLKSRNTGYLGIYAQGNLTTGRVFAGSTTAADATTNKGNYNYTDTSSEGYYQSFVGKPDSMRFWVKYTSGTKNSTYVYAKAKATIHKKGYYQDPESYNGTSYIDDGVVIARAEKVDITKCDWTSYSIKFDYEDEVSTPEYVLVSFSTNATPGESQEGEEMYIDDVEFIYNSSLSDLTYNGITLSDFKKDQYEYVVDNYYFEGCLGYTKDGVGGVVEVSEYDIEKGEVIITVKGDNISESPENYHRYTIKFSKSVISSIDYKDFLVVTVDGTSGDPQETCINVKSLSDGTYVLSLDNFMLGSGTDILPVGNIVLQGIYGEVSDEIVSLSADQLIKITSGNIDGIDTWFGPMLGDVPIIMSAKMYGNKMYCEIDIDMTSSMNQVINVVFGKPIVAQTQSAALTETGEAHVLLNRQFLKGWNTICLPFATTAEAVAGTGAKAQAFAGAGADGLDFAVAETMTANTPYLIYVPADTEAQTFIANVTLEEATPGTVTYGDFTFKGNYEANMPMADLYGVADKDGVQKIMKGSTTAQLQGTRAYFDYSGTSSVSGMRLNLEGEGGVTAIDGVQVLQGSFDIYNLQGIRVRTAATSLEGLSRGVYVVNGQKVMVK